MSDATACAGARATSVPCPHCDVLLGLQDTVHVEGVERGVDLLVVSPNQLSPISKAVERAYDKGIPVVLGEFGAAARHVQPQGPGQEEEDGEEEAVLQEEVGVHEKSSG